MSVRPVQLSATLKLLISQQPGVRVRDKICRAANITKSALSQYETGVSHPRLETLCRLADHLQVSLDYLVYGESSVAPRSGRDSDPLYTFIDTRLESIGLRAEERNWALFKIADMVVRRIDRVAERWMSQDRLSQEARPGRIDDQESVLLESYARSVQIFATDFTYDLIANSDGSYSPGKFFPTVCANINRGCRYRFILPKGRNWSREINAFQQFLRGQVGDRASSHCQLRVARRTYISGLGLLQIDIDRLRENDPALFYALSGYSANDYVAYIIPPSSRVHGDLLIASDRLSLTTELFEEVWVEAEQPVQHEFPRKRNRQ